MHRFEVEETVSHYQTTKKTCLQVIPNLSNIHVSSSLYGLLTLASGEPTFRNHLDFVGRYFLTVFLLFALNTKVETFGCGGFGVVYTDQ